MEYSYQELVEKKKLGEKLDWEKITKAQLEKLYYDNTVSNRLIAELYDVSPNTVLNKRRKWNISLTSSKRFYDEYKKENSSLFERLNKDSKDRLLNVENIDWIAKALTHYIFRNGPVEDMHANGQLSQNDMKVLNKYMVNKLAGLLKYCFDGEWIKVELILNYLQIYGQDWDPAEYDTHEVELIFRHALNIEPNCILMNKNKEILIADYDDDLQGFSEIYEVKNIDYAPAIIKNAYHHSTNESDFKKALSTWFRGRGIPSWRDDLDLLLTHLGVSAPEELLNKSFGLSLSDQYWLKPYDSNIKYDDINFFEHDFKNSNFVNSVFANDPNFDSSIFSPNNTTDGKLRKTWIVENGQRYLLKSGFRNEVMQPFNEVLASMICERLGFDHVTYQIDVINDKVVSKCACFINPDTEYIPAHQIMYNSCTKENAYEQYIQILEDHGIENARESIENMFILDYLILNEDRHLNNFGIIRNVNDLKWIRVAPIFDNGQSLNILDYNDEEVIINGKARFFYQLDNFDSLLLKVKNITRFNMQKLDGIVGEFENLLHQYQNITKITDQRINKICTLLASRINKLSDFIQKNS